MSESSQSRLDKLGLTAGDQEHFGNIQCADKRVLIRRAYCSSVLCLPSTNNVKLVEKKDVKRSASTCPDCKHVLFWESTRA